MSTTVPDNDEAQPPVSMTKKTSAYNWWAVILLVAAAGMLLVTVQSNDRVSLYSGAALGVIIACLAVVSLGARPRVISADRLGDQVLLLLVGVKFVAVDPITLEETPATTHTTGAVIWYDLRRAYLHTATILLVFTVVPWLLTEWGF